MMTNLMKELAKVNALRAHNQKNREQIITALEQREAFLNDAINHYRLRLQEKGPGENPLLERRFKTLLLERDKVQRTLNFEKERSKKKSA